MIDSSFDSCSDDVEEEEEVVNDGEAVLLSVVVVVDVENVIGNVVSSSDSEMSSGAVLTFLCE